MLTSDLDRTRKDVTEDEASHPYPLTSYYPSPFCSQTGGLRIAQTPCFLSNHRHGFTHRDLANRRMGIHKTCNICAGQKLLESSK